MKPMRHALCWLAASVSIAVSMVSGAGTAGAASAHLTVEPVLESPRNLDMEFGGFLGKRLKANMENWELRVPGADPALIEMFYDRDRTPSRNLLPWSGEFIGKYLCASILSYRILKDPRQKASIDRVVHAFIASQSPDGYLGPFNKSARLTGANTWDMWGHYWAIRGLLMYRSGYLPRIFGVLFMIAGAGFIAVNLATVLAPAYASGYLLMPIGIASLSLMLWLLVKGVDVPKWNARLAASG